MAVAQAIPAPSFFLIQNPASKTQGKLTHSTSQFSSLLKKKSHLQASIESGELAKAHHLADRIPQPNKFSWNSLIQHHLSSGESILVISIYREMLLGSVRPDNYTLPYVLTASRLSGNLFHGKQIHAQALKFGLVSNEYVVTALMSMYGHLDGAEAAHVLFSKSTARNSVSWTLLAGFYGSENRPDLAVEVFSQMVNSGAKIDSIALVTALGACGRMRSIHEGKKFHEIASRSGLESDILVGNSLLKMYIDCGSIINARAVFDQMPRKDNISWTAIIGGYVHSGCFNEGLKLFRAMHSEGPKGDLFTVSSILPACARVSGHKHGKEIHGYIIRNLVDLNVTAQNALMDMYVKSGSIESAWKIFTRISEKDVVSWTVMIMAYSLHGQGEVGVKLLHEMEKNPGIHPDQVTYVSVLHACNTARMVEEGRVYFNCIKSPKVGHCALMVSLLARAGLFEEAGTFIEEHQIERYAEVQRALLDGCRIHQNTKIGKRVIEQLTELEPLNAENYVMLSNIYAASAKWDMVNRLKEMIGDMGLTPKIAYSWIEVRFKVHAFGIGDVSHPRSKSIYRKLQDLVKKMEEELGFALDTSFALHDVYEERECSPYRHSEILATVFGLISTESGATLRITKNLRVCHNCHASLKMISKLVNREIMLKDPNRYHHFKNGFCSCGDFW